MTITGTVNSTMGADVIAVECYGTTLNSDYSSSSGAGTILITFIVVEGSVRIFCNSTCLGIDEHGKSNVITITGEGEVVVFSGQCCGVHTVHK